MYIAFAPTGQVIVEPQAMTTNPSAQLVPEAIECKVKSSHLNEIS